MKNYKITIVLFLALGLGSCSDFDLIKPGGNHVSLADKLNTNKPQSYTLKANQTYGSKQFQNYDLYIPNRNAEDIEAKSVTLVLVHGGGWSILDKSFLNNVVEDFKKRNLNLTIFNINHRLAGIDNVRFQDIMDDFNLFFQHYESLKTPLNLSDDLMLWGYSSGGHLALSYAYKYGHEDIKLVTAISSPTDLTEASIYKGIIDPKFGNMTERLIGRTYEEDPGAYKNASPYHMASRGLPSTLLFYGSQDDLVNKSQGEKLKENLRKKKVPVEFHLMPQATHDVGGAEITKINDNLMYYSRSIK
jgi:acetyl esterase/lipase